MVGKDIVYSLGPPPELFPKVFVPPSGGASAASEAYSLITQLVSHEVLQQAFSFASKQSDDLGYHTEVTDHEVGSTDSAIRHKLREYYAGRGECYINKEEEEK